MSKQPASSSSRPVAEAKKRKARQAPRRPKQAVPARRWRPWFLPVGLAGLGFLLGFTLDMTGLLRLFWACLTGAFGVVPWIAATAVLIVVVTPIILRLQQHRAVRMPSRTSARKKPPRRSVPVAAAAAVTDSARPARRDRGTGGVEEKRAVRATEQVGH